MYSANVFVLNVAKNFVLYKVFAINVTKTLFRAAKINTGINFVALHHVFATFNAKTYDVFTLNVAKTYYRTTFLHQMSQKLCTVLQKSMPASTFAALHNVFATC